MGTCYVGLGTSLIDFNNALEITCSGLGRVELIGGGQACFVLYRNSVVDPRRGLRPQICGRVFMPLSTTPDALQLTAEALVHAGMCEAERIGPRLMC